MTEKKNKIIGAAIIIAAIALVAIIAVTVINKVSAAKLVEIDMIKMMDVSFSGISGEAQAKCQINEEYFLEWYNDENREKITDEAIDKLFSNENFELSQKTEIKNGDEITFTLKLDKEKFKNLGINIVGDNSKTVKASGLNEIKEIDLFEGLKITVSGTLPQPTVNIDTSQCSEDIQKLMKLTDGFALTYRFMNAARVKKCDKIKIEAEIIESTLNNYGYTAKDEIFQKEYPLPEDIALDEEIVFLMGEEWFESYDNEIIVTTEPHTENDLVITADTTRAPKPAGYDDEEDVAVTYKTDENGDFVPTVTTKFTLN